VLEGPAPTLATMADGTYSAARPVYVYAQRSHLDWNRAARKLADDLTDQDAVGPDGYLVRLGLVPLETRESQRPLVKEHSR
jgi:phosphate transport system substrate-binding protein